MSSQERSKENDKHKKKNDKRISNNRRFLSQFLAVTVKNTLLFDMGLCINYPVIIIAAVNEITRNAHNKNERLNITVGEISWLGSIGFIVLPIGSIISAFTIDPLGRKRAMLVSNIPFIIAWIMMYNASEVWHILLANTLMGFAIGLMQPPVITYIGEISEPTYRGVLIGYTNLCGTIGSLVVFGLNTIMPWRTVGLVCMFVPIVSMIALFFVPETPQWLITKNRLPAAEKALTWLRGWTSKEDVAEEFQELQRYSQRSKSCRHCIEQNETCNHPLPTLKEKMFELTRMPTLKPLFLVTSLFVFAEFTGITGMHPYLAPIFKAYDIPIAPDLALTIIAIMMNFANLTNLCVIRFTGKRPLYLTMLFVLLLCCAIISGYGFFVLPKGYNSIDKSQTFRPENEQLTYIPLVLIIMWSFCSHCGVNSLPWQLLSEVYPMRVRGMATGFSACLDYLFRFITTKTYCDLEVSLSLAGISAFNFVMAGVGMVLMCLIMPETEHRTLEEIELHFADHSKKITDRKISKIR